MYLEDPSKTEELREINKILKEQITRAARLINNTRRLSQIEEEKIELHKVNLCEQLSRTVEFINKSYQSRKMNLNLNCDFETIIIKANDLIQDLFENLIMNAVKHNDSEIIEISIKVSIINIKENSRARIEFIDNGIGISDEKKKNLFKPNSKKTSSRGGMGLGLSLVKKILNIYGGEIWVENRVEGDYTQGSNFVVEFPVIK
jgi:signal transduction histidine kinase